MKNINSIPENFVELFSNSNIGISLRDANYILVQHYDSLKQTPREKAMQKHFPVDAFYYINFLLENNPEIIYDIGCGVNFFKNYFPNIVGIDPAHSMADKVDYFDDTFVGNHCEWAEAIIAINSLHFIPLNQFIKRLDQLNFVLKKQGRAYVTFNVQRVIEFTSVNEFLEIGLIKEEILDRNNNSLIMLENHFRKLLENSNFKFLCVDIDFKKYAVEASVDGNIRLVMEK